LNPTPGPTVCPPCSGRAAPGSQCATVAEFWPAQKGHSADRGPRRPVWTGGKMHFPSVVLPAIACVAVLIRGAEAGELPPLRCTLAGAPGATCAWTIDGPGCTREEAGTPTVCRPLAGAGVELRTAGTYRGGYNNAAASSGVAYDAKTHRLFVANGATQTVDVVDLGGGVATACSISVADPQAAVTVTRLHTHPPGSRQGRGARGGASPAGRRDPARQGRPERDESRRTTPVHFRHGPVPGGGGAYRSSR
jgi:hypothetical protein